MNVTVKRSDIELKRELWKKIAKEHNWYKEPFYVQVWVHDDGSIEDSVSCRDVMTKDYIIPNDGFTVIIDENN